MADRNRHEELVITKTYDLILWSCNQTGKFPPNHRLRRFHMRLAKDLQRLKVESYGFAVKAIDEIGKLVGGWLQGGGKQSVAAVPLRPGTGVVETLSSVLSV